MSEIEKIDKKIHSLKLHEDDTEKECKYNFRQISPIKTRLQKIKANPQLRDSFLDDKVNFSIYLIGFVYQRNRSKKFH